MSTEEKAQPIDHLTSDLSPSTIDLLKPRVSELMIE